MHDRHHLSPVWFGTKADEAVVNRGRRVL